MLIGWNLSILPTQNSEEQLQTALENTSNAPKQINES